MEIMLATISIGSPGNRIVRPCSDISKNMHRIIDVLVDVNIIRQGVPGNLVHDLCHVIIVPSCPAMTVDERYYLQELL